MELSLTPSVSWNHNPWQYVGRRWVTGEPRYLVGELRQATTALTTRLSYTFTPTLSLQLYAQPFVSAGEYAAFREVREPRAARFAQRFHTYSAEQLEVERPAGEAALYRVDATGDGTPDFALRDPSFNVKQFRSNAVLRWEYRPASTLFLVWSQNRSGFAPDGSLALTRDFAELMDGPASNVFLVKLSYWLGM